MRHKPSPLSVFIFGILWLVYCAIHGCVETCPASNVQIGFYDDYGNQVSNNFTLTQLQSPIQYGNFLAYSTPHTYVMTNWPMTISNMAAGNWALAVRGQPKVIVLAVPPNDNNTWFYTSLINSNVSYYAKLATVFMYWTTNLDAWAQINPNTFTAGAGANAVTNIVPTNGPPLISNNVLLVNTNQNYDLVGSAAADSAAAIAEIMAFSQFTNSVTNTQTQVNFGSFQLSGSGPFTRTITAVNGDAAAVNIAQNSGVTLSDSAGNNDVVVNPGSTTIHNPLNITAGGDGETNFDERGWTNNSVSGVTANAFNGPLNGNAATATTANTVLATGSTANQVLTSTGPSTAPTFQNLPSGNSTNLAGYFANLSPSASLTPVGILSTPTGPSAGTNLVALTNSTAFDFNNPTTNIAGGVPIAANFNGTNIGTRFNAGFSWTNAFTPNIYYVRTNGNDATGFAGDPGRPWLTFTNALAAVVAPAIIDLGAGTFWTDPRTNGSIVPSNVSIRGQGVNATMLNVGNLILSTTNSIAATNCPGLVIDGDNVELKDFTMGTNAMAGEYYFPMEVYRGTNLYVHNLTILGDSDCIYGNAAAFPNVLSNNVSPLFENVRMKSGYDDAVFAAANGTGATNSIIAFHTCSFVVSVDPNFQVNGNFPSRGLYLQHVTADVRNCVFNITNSYESYGVFVNAPAGITNILTLQNNAFNLSGGGTALNNVIVNNGALAQTYLIGWFNTASASFGSSQVSYDNGVNTNNISAAGSTSGQVLTSTGSGTAPVFLAASGGTSSKVPIYIVGQITGSPNIPSVTAGGVFYGLTGLQVSSAFYGYQSSPIPAGNYVATLLGNWPYASFNSGTNIAMSFETNGIVFHTTYVVGPITQNQNNFFSDTWNVNIITNTGGTFALTNNSAGPVAGDPNWILILTPQ